MCNGFVKYLARDKGISIEEAQMVCEERKKFRKFFKEENINENYREEREKGQVAYPIQEY